MGNASKSPAISPSLRAISVMMMEFRRLEALEGNEPIRCSRIHFGAWADTLVKSLFSEDPPTQNATQTSAKTEAPVPQATSASAQAELERANNAEAVLRYELSLEAHEEVIGRLRDEVARLEGENLRLREERRRRYMRPPVFSFMGFHMESADIDG